MLNERLKVTRDITIQIAELEKQLDAVIVSEAKLQIAMIEGRRSASLPLDAGQIGFERLAEARTNLIGARAAVHAAHYDLKAVRDELRLPVHAYGDSGDTPSKFASTGAAETAPVLTLVDAA